MAKKPTPPPVTKKRAAWANARGGATFKGKPLVPSAAPEERYRKRIEKAIRVMREETEREVAKLWAAHRPAVRSGMDASLASQARILTNALARRFQAFFDKLAPGLADSFISEVTKASAAGLHSSLKEMSGGISLKTSVIDGTIKEMTKASVAENVGLIKSIPREYFQRIQGAVMRGITAGNGAAEVLETVKKSGAITDRRAELIARDQTSKATTHLNSARMKSLGVQKFEWLHSGGGREPRPLHRNVLDGQVFSLDDPPVIDENTGERGLPGQLINCRCRMVPVVDFGTDE